MGLVGNLVWAIFHQAVLTQRRASREAIDPEQKALGSKF